jgi:hypothetical protein
MVTEMEPSHIFRQLFTFRVLLKVEVNHGREFRAAIAPERASRCAVA